MGHFTLKYHRLTIGTNDILTGMLLDGYVGVIHALYLNVPLLPGAPGTVELVIGAMSLPDRLGSFADELFNSGALAEGTIHVITKTIGVAKIPAAGLELHSLRMDTTIPPTNLSLAAGGSAPFVPGCNTLWLLQSDDNAGGGATNYELAILFEDRGNEP